MLKVAIFMYLFIWYRATWPRYRFDQLMKVGWKVHAADFAGRADADRHRGGARPMNPAVNVRRRIPVATPFFFYVLAAAAVISGCW